MSDEDDWEAYLDDDTDNSTLAQAPTNAFEIHSEQISRPEETKQKVNLEQMSQSHYTNKKEIPQSQYTNKKEDLQKPSVKAPREQEKPVLKPQPIDKDQLIASSKPEEQDPRPNLNLLFIGHVDSGKSTLCGNLLLSLGKVDERIVQSYEREARENNRSSWWLAYIMDTNEEERLKGKTIEVGKAFIEVANKRVVILDAPGHRNYVPNMVLGSAQADLIAIILSARTGEFESGFEKGGQSTEHVLIAKSRGISHFVVLVTKMDEVDWDPNRFQEIVDKFSIFLTETCKITSAVFIPVSGLHGTNLIRTGENWYTGPSLIEYIEGIELGTKNPSESLVMPILDYYKDQGAFVSCKVERGTVVKGLKVVIRPIDLETEVNEIYGHEERKMVYALPGDNVRLKLKTPDNVKLEAGFVICDVHDLCSVSKSFEVEVALLNLPTHKPIISAGFECLIHIHTLTQNVVVTEIIGVSDPTKGKLVKAGFAVSNSKMIAKLEVTSAICLESKEFPQMSNFVLRDENLTIGIGRVRKVLS